MFHSEPGNTGNSRVHTDGLVRPPPPPSGGAHHRPAAVIDSRTLTIEECLERGLNPRTILQQVLRTSSDIPNDKIRSFIRRCDARICALSVASIGVSLLAIKAGVAGMLGHDSYFLISYCALDLISLILPMFKPPDRGPAAPAPITTLVHGLATKAGIAPPTVHMRTVPNESLPQISVAAFILPWLRPYAILSAKFQKFISQEISSSEAIGLLAHEVSHIKHLPDLRLVATARLFSRISNIAVAGGVAALAMAHAPAGSIQRFFVGAGAYLLAMAANSVLKAFLDSAINRSVESKTDVEAVRLVGDPTSYTTALTRLIHWHDLSASGEPRRRKARPLPAALLPHPPLEQRIANIKAVFGE